MHRNGILSVFSYSYSILNRCCVLLLFSYSPALYVFVFSYFDFALLIITVTYSSDNAVFIVIGNNPHSNKQLLLFLRLHFFCLIVQSVCWFFNRKFTRIFIFFFNFSIRIKIKLLIFKWLEKSIG